MVDSYDVHIHKEVYIVHDHYAIKQWKINIQVSLI